ncbi:TonB-dependent hemoglobin/transferrin/lactoferrin family receptor [Methylomonas koyamae]|uniref:TonB-dependent hemoglobin/transferrin/lactoferrin family receptor n=1 Tax=Methylomonas koyamae TaxID=702114 RepID=UPI0011261CDD|nr:TonB-dependent hemoglobin/transferrin/lactoferrin family receptor [Methylomonas koyamae]TPQ29247.1 TonB-dependent hemoglobin/transferrin/lactoferrin family receptor [Methylomonas koyamae]
MATKLNYSSTTLGRCPCAACAESAETCSRAALCTLLWLLAATPLAAEPVEAEVVEAPEELELETVTVKAQTEKSAATPPGTQSTIDAKTIEQRMIRNIKDLIRYEPGVNVGNDPQRFGASGFTIRGLGGNRVLMQIDGVRLPEAFSIGSFSNATRNAVDMDALKAVEIVRGAGPAAYGGDAMGGTVNFVTKDPRDYLNVFGKDYYTGLKLNYNTTDNGFTQTATFAGALGGWESMALFTHMASNETDNKGTVETLGSTRTTPSPQDNGNYNLLTKLLYRFDDDNILRLSGEWLHSRSDVDALYMRGPDISLRTVNSMLTTDTQSRWRLTLDHTLKHLHTALFDDALWKFYTQKSATGQITLQDRTARTDGNTLTERIFDFANDDFGGELKLGKSFDWADTHHHLQYGGQISQNSIAQLRDGSYACISGSFHPVSGLPTATCPQGRISKTVTPDEFPVRDFPLSTVTKAGAYLEDTIELFDKRIELIPGGRWEYFRLLPKVDYLFQKASDAAVAEGADPVIPSIIDASAFLPRFGALLHLNQVFTVHGQYSHGFRGPNFSESNLGFTNVTGGYSNLPNFNIQAETSVGAEVGLRGQGAAGRFDVSVYRNDYQNFIYNAVICNPASAVCPPLGFTTYQNINSPDPIRIQGVELKSQWFLDWLHPALIGSSLLFSGAYTQGKNLRTQQQNDDALRQISPMKAVVGLRYDQPDGDWGSELNLTLVSAKRGQTAPSDALFLPNGYGVLDFNAYYNVSQHLSFNVGVFNLLDKKYIDWEDINTRAGDPHTTLGNFADARYWADRYSRPGRNLGVSMKLAF